MGAAFLVLGLAFSSLSLAGVSEASAEARAKVCTSYGTNLVRLRKVFMKCLTSQSFPRWCRSGGPAGCICRGAAAAVGGSEWDTAGAQH